MTSNTVEKKVVWLDDMSRTQLYDLIENLSRTALKRADKADALVKALEKIKNIHTTDCAKYVRMADDIACEALAAFEEAT